MLDLEGEMSQLQEATAAAESRADALELAAATAKDQLVRLTADFENFRRRTVGVAGTHGG
jgi:molecular chaperone GrpE (heat shock protein)